MQPAARPHGKKADLRADVDDRAVRRWIEAPIQSVLALDPDRGVRGDVSPRGIDAIAVPVELDGVLVLASLESLELRDTPYVMFNSLLITMPA